MFKFIKTFVFTVALLLLTVPVFGQNTIISTISLQWDKNPETDEVVYYNIYTTHASGEYLDLAIMTVPHDYNDGLDTVSQDIEVTYLEGQTTTFYFVVTAVAIFVDADGQEYILESDLSNEVSKTFNVVIPVPPSAPTGLTITNVNTQL